MNKLPPDSPDDPPLRPGYYFICVGVTHYEDCRLSLPLVEEEMRGMMVAMRRQGYKLELAELTEKQTKEKFLEIVGNWFSDKSQRTENDIVVFYFTGHGYDTGIDFYLLLGDSRVGDNYNLGSTAIPVRELGKRILAPYEGQPENQKKPYSQVLIILDVCWSGIGALEIIKLQNELIGKRLANTAGVYVVTSSRATQEAGQNAFVKEFTEVVLNPDKQWGGENQKFLSIGSIVRAINERFERKKLTQRGAWDGHDEKESELFPNPRYKADLAVGLDIETQMERSKREVVSGPVEMLASVNMYFTGRTKALSELIGWLKSGVNADKVRVITGSPGTGKSALLARLAYLLEPGHQERLYESDALVAVSEGVTRTVKFIYIGIDAKSKTPNDIVSLLCDGVRTSGDVGVALESTIDNVEPLLKALQESKLSFVVVVDSLDEAVDSPQNVNAKLLQPLKALSRVKLIVGSQPLDPKSKEIAIPGLHTKDQQVNLDLPEYLGPRDMFQYVKSRLLAKVEPNKKTPYQDKEENFVDEVAKAVAEKAGNNFLIARIVSGYLRGSPAPIDGNQANWQFPETVDDALGELFNRFDASHVKASGFNKLKAIDLLMPLALAQGEGLPWEDIWAPLATRMSGRSCTDSDIELLMKYAGAYIVEALESGRSVYRLYHQAVTKYLSAKATDESHQKIAETLIDLTPTLHDGKAKDWLRAHPYVRKYLALHAAESPGILAGLVLEPLYLIAADRTCLLGVLHKVRARDLSDAAHVYQLAVDRVNADKTEESIAYLEMVAHQQGMPELAKRFGSAAPNRPWFVQWAHWKASSPHMSIVNNQYTRVGDLELTEFKGKPIFVWRAWSITSDHKWGISSIKRDHDPPDTDRQLRVFDLAEGKERLDIPEKSIQVGRMLAVTTLDERPHIISASSSKGVQLWDLATGRHVRNFPRFDLAEGDNFFVNALTVVKRIGANLVVASVSVYTAATKKLDETLEIMDLATGERRGHCSLSGKHDYGYILKFAVAELDGRTLLISMHDKHVQSKNSFTSLHVWDLNGQHIKTIQCRGVSEIALTVRDGASGRIASEAITVATFRESQVIVTGHLDGTICLWDIGTGKGLGFIYAHTREVTSIIVVEAGAQLKVASGGADGSIRLWDLTKIKSLNRLEKNRRFRNLDEPIREFRGHKSEIRTLKLSLREGKQIIISCGNDETIRIWSLEELTKHSPTKMGSSHYFDVLSRAFYSDNDRFGLTLGKWESRPVVVLMPMFGNAHLDGVVSRMVLDVETGEDAGVSLKAPGGFAVEHMTAVAAGELKLGSVIACVYGSWGISLTYDDFATDIEQTSKKTNLSFRDALFLFNSGGGRSRGFHNALLYQKYGRIVSVAVGGPRGSPVIVTYHDSGWLVVRDFRSFDYLRTIFDDKQYKEHFSRETRVVIVEIDEVNCVIVYSSRDSDGGTIKVLDLASGQMYGGQVGENTKSAIRCGYRDKFAVGVFDGRLIVATLGDSKITSHAWDSVSGRWMHKFLPCYEYIDGSSPIALGNCDGRDLIAFSHGETLEILISDTVVPFSIETGAEIVDVAVAKSAIVVSTKKNGLLGIKLSSKTTFGSV